MENNIHKKRFILTPNRFNALRKEFQSKFLKGQFSEEDYDKKDNKKLSPEELEERRIARRDAQREAAHIRTERDNEIGC